MARGYDWANDPDRLKAEHAARLAEESAMLERYRRMPKQSNFSFGAKSSFAFRELVAELQGAAHPTLSQSQMLELLIWHWRQHPPPVREMLDFEFETKRGRPRRTS